MRVKLVIVHCKQSKCQMVPQLQVLAGDDTRVLTSSVSTLLTMGARGWSPVMPGVTSELRSVSPQLSAGSGVGGTRRSVLSALSHKVTVTTLYLAI